MISWEVGALLCGTFLVSGIVDSIAGGGGLLQMPALLLSGLPPQLTLGTNKFASTLGTMVAAMNYIRKGKAYFPIIAHGIVFTLMGGALGAKLVLFMPQEVVGKLLLALLPIGLVALVVKRTDIISLPILSSKDKWLAIPLICILLGIYDGFFGPGTGSFLTLGLYIICRRDLIESTANAKVFNLVSNISAVAVFLHAGKVMFPLAIPLAGSSMLGNFIGSQFVAKKGQGVIRGCLIFVFVILIITLAARYL